MVSFAPNLRNRQAASGAAAPHGPPPPPDYDGKVVFWVDIFLVLCLAIFVFPLVLKAFGRLRTRSDWGRGLFICECYAVGLGTALTFCRRWLSDYTKPLSDDTSSARTIPHIAQTTESILEKRGAITQPLPHVKSLASRFYLLTRVIDLQLPFQGYHLGQGLLLILYFGTLLFATLYRSSPFKTTGREGAIVASQLPWLYILATKNNAIGLLVGYGYEKVCDNSRITSEEL